MDFDVINTNIVNMAADAIVLPANTRLKEGPGASKAIFEAAGRDKLTEACKKLGSCKEGSAVATPAFDMNADYIVHTVVPKWKNGKQDEYARLSQAWLVSLQLADELGCRSVAIPLLASGNNGYDKELAFLIAKESIASFQPKNLEKVCLVVYGHSILSIVEKYGYELQEIPRHLRGHAALLVSEGAQPVVLSQNAVQNQNDLQKFFEEQIQNAVKFVSDPENVIQALNQGIVIVDLALKLFGKRR